MRAKYWTISAIWLAWGVISSLYLLMIAASSIIPFGNTPISLAEVIRSVAAAGVLSRKVSFLWQTPVLAVSVAPVLVYTFSRWQRFRLRILLLCLAAPPGLFRPFSRQKH
jgi:hypothetical protein